MRTALCLMLAVLLAPQAHAQAVGDLRIEVVHAGSTDFSLTPLWFGLHNGQFDMFDVGSPAASSLGTNAVELVAELGDVGQLTADFTAAPGIPGDIQGVAVAAGNGVPPIEPGETGVGYATPINPAGYQYFSFLSMVVPTNDAFVGNDDPLAYRVFNDLGQLIDAGGNPVGARVIPIFASGVFDAGTEVNGAGGAAFAQGQVGTEGADENGVVTAGADLSGFLGLTDATGRLIADGLAPGELFATIRISRVVPEPSAAVVALLGVAGLVRRH